MDPITHTLTGLALSRAGLKRATPYATPILLLAANGPDIDIVTAFGGAANYLHYHRHITHAFIGAPVLALAAVLIVRLFARKKPIPWRRAYAVALIGALSHPFLDSWNIYGIRLLLPWSQHWFRLDLVSLPDIWIWLILLLAVIVPALSKLVSGEIGARPQSGRGAAITALVLVLAYVFGRWVLHQRAVAVMDAHLYEGVSPVEVAALPGPVNPFAWRGLVDGGSFYALTEVNLLGGDFDPTRARIVHKAMPGPREAAAAEAARQTETFRVFLGFSQYPAWRFLPAEEVEDGIRVEAYDLRFGGPDTPRFVATAIVDAAGRVRRHWFSFRPRR